MHPSCRWLWNSESRKCSGNSSISKTNVTKQNQFHRPFREFADQITMWQCYPYFTKQNIEDNQHRTITFSTCEDNLQYTLNVKSILTPSHKKTLSTMPAMPYL